MDNGFVRKIVEREKEVLATLDGIENIEASYVCPHCGGTAHLTLHEWRGYTSYCENGCFSNR